MDDVEALGVMNLEVRAARVAVALKALRPVVIVMEMELRQLVALNLELRRLMELTPELSPLVAFNLELSQLEMGTLTVWRRLEKILRELIMR